MKRWITLFLLVCILLSGCTLSGERIKDPVTFYYVRQDYQDDMGQVTVSEEREASGHRQDLPYLLALYSMGPATEGLVSPLPSGTHITVAEQTETAIVLNLSESGQQLSDAQLTLASACLGMTCMELTQATQVTVCCDDRTITIQQENLLIQADGGLQQTEGSK